MIDCRDGRKGETRDVGSYMFTTSTLDDRDK